MTIWNVSLGSKEDWVVILTFQFGQNTGYVYFPSYGIKKLFCLVLSS